MKTDKFKFEVLKDENIDLKYLRIPTESHSLDSNLPGVPALSIG